MVSLNAIEEGPTEVLGRGTSRDEGASTAIEVIADAIAETNVQQMQSVILDVEAIQTEKGHDKDEGLSAKGEGIIDQRIDEIALVTEIHVNSILNQSNGTSVTFTDGKVSTLHEVQRTSHHP